jgi:hypothetical protein
MSATFGFELSQSNVAHFELYTSGEVCVSFKTILLPWNDKQMVIIVPFRIYAKFYIENYGITYARIMVHDCNRNSSDKLIPHWCGYFHPSIQLTEKSKVYLIGLLAKYEIFSYRRNIEKFYSNVMNITKFKAKSPLSSNLSTYNLCKSCLGTCHRPCSSVALGRNETTCVYSETTTTQNLTFERVRKEENEMFFRKYFEISTNSADKCSLQNIAVILSFIFMHGRTQLK